MAWLGKVLFVLILSIHACFAETPRWITKDNCYNLNNRGKVIEVTTAENADLIIIDTGLQSNFRIGAICSVDCPENKTAKVVIVEANQERSVGLVMTNTEIQKGAAVYITAN